MNNYGIKLLCLVGALVVSGCVSKDVEFSGKSTIDFDGTVNRSGRLKIILSGERNIENDLSAALNYYHENFVSPDENIFQVQQTFDDSVLTISWTGSLAAEDFPLSDFTHRIGDGPSTGNIIALTRKNRWFFSDWVYSEVFSDPVDTSNVLPLLERGLAGASEKFVNLGPLKGLKDRAGAMELLKIVEKDIGVNLLNTFLENPQALDSLSDLYESKIEVAADSLAGFAGVKLAPDSLTALLGSVYGAVWDTLLIDHPGLFGSYGIGESETHEFEVEVVYPGCLVASNADTTIGAACVWTFDRLDFFAREKRLEITYRIWSWGKIVVTAVAVLLLLVAILWPIRKKRV